MTSAPSPLSTPTPKLLDRVRQAVRVRGYSLRTEESHTDWHRRFILFHGERHPAEMGTAAATLSYALARKAPNPQPTALGRTAR